MLGRVMALARKRAVDGHPTCSPSFPAGDFRILVGAQDQHGGSTLARRAVRGPAGLLVAGVLCAWSTDAQAMGEPPGSLDECDSRVRERPKELESYRCYDLYAQNTRDDPGALKRLEEI